MIEKGMKLLLNNFWIIKENNKEDYYYLKQNKEKLEEYINKNLGSKLIINDRFIKLEKIPATPSDLFGILEFESTLDYVLIFLLLLYLEDKPKGEKFVLTDLTQSLKNSAVSLELDQVPNWDLASNRKSLLRVLKFIENIGLIRLLDKLDTSFEESVFTEILYESSGLSNYFLPSFDFGATNAKTKEDFIELDISKDDEDSDSKRYKVYRNLLYKPATVTRDLKASELDYLRKMHKNIKEDIKDNLNMDTEITRNMALCFMEDSLGKTYPNSRRISDIILIVNKELLNLEHTLDDSEIFTISIREFYDLLNSIKEKYKDYFSKEILNLSDVKYLELITTKMREYSFIDAVDSKVFIYPSITRFVGKTEEKKIDDYQLRMEVM